MPPSKETFGLSALALLAALAQASGQEVFTDNFDRPDGPPDGWAIFSGGWKIAGGQLSIAAPGQENWIWAGSPPIRPAGDFDAQVTVQFANRPALPVGRHGGLMFFASVATQRTDPQMTGYTIDWIDRANDHGFRLIRWDPGTATANAATFLLFGTPGIIDPPSLWQVEAAGDLIRFSADGNLIFEVIDSTYREGYFGAWTWLNNTQMRLDDLTIHYTSIKVDACFAASSQSGTAPLTVDFDASCSTIAGTPESYNWDFGDGKSAEGKQVAHEFQFPDTYTVQLTVKDTEGNADAATALIKVFAAADNFADDFARDDGPPGGWTVYQGAWAIQGQALTTTTAGPEDWIWAGDPAASFPNNFEARLDYQFLATPLDAVGRHGGIMFCTTVPTHRYDSEIGGYTVDWIDRCEPPPGLCDHGFRLIRIDRGAQTVLIGGTPALAEPPPDWRLVVEGDLIRFYAGGDLQLEAVDSTYRGGFFGCWAWVNGQNPAIDNVQITSPEVQPCFTVSPGPLVQVGTDLTFDAGCSTAKGTAFTSYDWNFGDNATGSGAVVEHIYQATGAFPVKLTLKAANGSTSSIERIVTVFEPASSFEDKFAQPDGPPPGWTIAGGGWTIQSEQLFIDTPAAPESWIWAGDPPFRFLGIEVIEFEVKFIATPLDEVGRHGGVFIFALNAQPRFNGNSGYSIDWIDRCEPDLCDHGYRFSRWDNGFETSLLIAGSGEPDPGKKWHIEIEGDTIRLLVDGQVKGEVADGTYRLGHIGFWSYFNGQQLAFDNVKIGKKEILPPEKKFRRGDVDDSGAVDISDPINELHSLFLGDFEITCQDAADFDDSGQVDISDAINSLLWQFASGSIAPLPGPFDCGPDPTADLDDQGNPADLGCEATTKC